MNDDALAAVAAAARLLIAGDGAEPAAAAEVRWIVAARMRADGVGRGRLCAGSRSRWARSGRLRD